MMNTAEQDTSYYVRVNELKNYVYCPRITFYTLCMGLDRETESVQVGIISEGVVKERLKRRKHALHAVKQGLRLLDVPMWSHSLRIVGKIDEIVQTKEGLYLVDYKDAERDYGYWKLQLVAYRLCAEENGSNPVLGTFVYVIPKQEYFLVQTTERDVHKLHVTLDAIETLIALEVCPPPTSQVSKCRVCQYASFCNDVF